jgi:hypothetical protein
MTIPEISAAITSARAIGDIFKGLVSLGIDSQVKEAVIDAQNIILQLQNQMFAILDRFEEQSTELSELREKLKRYETWDVDVTKYELVDLSHNRIVYRLINPRAPLVSYCAHCFGNRKLEILQDYYCQECKRRLFD